MFCKFTIPGFVAFLTSLCLCMALSGAANAQKNDVRSGMKIDDALYVAKKCVEAASGFDDDLKAEHTLKFVGIADSQHLDLLRRYVIINLEIGVQSIWAVDGNTLLAQHYIIPKSALAKMDGTWTIEKLAGEISKSSGLAKMPLSKAASIVADCRYFAMANDAERRRFIDSIGTLVDPPPKPPSPRPGDPPPAPTPTPTPTSTVIKYEMPDGRRDRPDFINCIAGETVGGIETGTIGVRNAGITTPKSDFYPYEISKSVYKSGVDSGWSYQKLIVFIARYANAPLSPKLTATQVVASSLLESKPDPPNPAYKGTRTMLMAAVESVPKSAITPAGCSYNSNFSTFVLRDKLPVNTREDSTLWDLGINPADFIAVLVRLLTQNIATDPACDKFFLTIKKDTKTRAEPVALVPQDFKGRIRDKSTVTEIIDIVANVIAKKLR